MLAGVDLTGVQTVLWRWYQRERCSSDVGPRSDVGSTWALCVVGGRLEEEEWQRKEVFRGKTLETVQTRGALAKHTYLPINEVEVLRQRRRPRHCVEAVVDDRGARGASVEVARPR